LRTLLIVVALASLPLVVVVRELRYRAALQVEQERAEANFRMARAAVDQYLAQVAERSAAPGPQIDKTRRDLLERSLRFYEGMESKASSPDERAKVRDRMEKIRTELQRDQHADEGSP
jgi:hypothetical protein